MSIHFVSFVSHPSLHVVFDETPPADLGSGALLEVGLDRLQEVARLSAPRCDWVFHGVESVPHPPATVASMLCAVATALDGDLFVIAGESGRAARIEGHVQRTLELGQRPPTLLSLFVHAVRRWRGSRRDDD